MSNELDRVSVKETGMFKTSVSMATFGEVTHGTMLSERTSPIQNTADSDGTCAEMSRMAELAAMNGVVTRTHWPPGRVVASAGPSPQRTCNSMLEHCTPEHIAQNIIMVDTLFSGTVRCSIANGLSLA
jgi:hypothetical protein